MFRARVRHRALGLFLVALAALLLVTGCAFPVPQEVEPREERPSAAPALDGRAAAEEPESELVVSRSKLGDEAFARGEVERAAIR